MMLLNKYVCDKGHVRLHLQSDEPQACLVCFREWQEKMFPLTQQRLARCPHSLTEGEYCHRCESKVAAIPQNQKGE